MCGEFWKGWTGKGGLTMTCLRCGQRSDDVYNCNTNSITILTTCMANRPMVVRPIHECRLQKFAIGGTVRLRESHTVRKPMTMAGTARMWNTWTTENTGIRIENHSHWRRSLVLPYERVSCKCDDSSQTNGTTIVLFFNFPKRKHKSKVF